MSPEEIRDRAAHSYEKASDVSRQLAFAGIALVWLMTLQHNNPGGMAQRMGPDPTGIPRHLVRPAVAFCVSVALDILQYGASAFGWWRLSRSPRGRTKPGRGYRSASATFFGLKLLALAFGFYVLTPSAFEFFKPPH